MQLPQLRVSATALEGWRRYCSTDFLTMEQYLTRLLGLEAATPAMAAGTRFHREVELGELVIGTRTKLRRASVTEMPIQRSLGAVGGFDVTLSGRVDAIAGLQIIDYKTSSKFFDMESLFESLQWRTYLVLNPDASSVRYELFRLVGRGSNRGWQHDGSFVLRRYGCVETDVRVAVASYVDMVSGLCRSGKLIVSERGYLDKPDMTAHRAGQARSPF